MALTVTVSEIAAALRITADATQPPSEPVNGILTRHWSVANSEIEGYAPDAPQEVKNEAAIRFIGYLFEQSPTGNVSQSPMRHSGALALLASSHVSTPVNSGTPLTPVLPSGATPETGINPAQPVHPGTHTRHAGWSDDTTVDAADVIGSGQSQTGHIIIPSHLNNAYLFFAVPQSVGYPTSLIIGGNSFNQITAFIQQPGTIDVGGDSFLVGLNTNLLNVSLFAGQTMTLGH